MQPFSVHTGKVATMDRSNVDTDQIIPKQFLKRIERTGFGVFLFYDWRYVDNETPNADFELNQPRFEAASILIARRNFGGGSSREHAVWALMDYGFRCVIAESLADIFYNNCFKNGMLPISLSKDEIQTIFENVEKHDGYQLTVDLETQTVSDEFDFSSKFDIDPFRKHCLLNGLDDIELTLQKLDQIKAFEAARGYQPVE